MKGSKLLLLGAALVALAMGAWLGATLAGRSASAPAISGTVFPEPRPLPDFQLLDQNGQPYTPERLKDRWTLAYFGYTYCPDVCPTTLYELARADALLDEAGEADDVGYALISVDPERDTPERLAQYVAHFGEKFSGATGPVADLEVLTRPLGIVFAKVEGDDPDNYLVDHSSSVIVINPDGELQAIFSAPQKADAMAADMRAVKDYYSR